MLRVISIWQNLEMLIMKLTPVGNKDVRERRLIVLGKRAPGAEPLNYAAQVAAGKTGAKTNREKRINCCGDSVQ